VNHFLVDCIIVILLGPWAYFKSKAWLASFKQFKAEQRYYHHQKASLLLEKQHNEMLLEDIFSKESPFNLFPDELVNYMGKCIYLKIQGFNNALTQLEYDHGD
jgi:hypothetical protein